MASYPWANGTYKFQWDRKFLGTVTIQGKEAYFEGFGIAKGDVKSHVDIEVGCFETTDKRGLEKSGLEKYSVKITLKGLNNWIFHANVSTDGNIWTLENGESMELMSEEDLKKYENEFDSAEKYSHFYEHHPENQGKIIWITGATGMGKTTTGELLAKEAGFILYDGDAFLYNANPYTLNSPKGPSFFGTKSLKNIPAKRKEAQDAVVKAYYKLFDGEESPFHVWTDFYELLCEDILKEKKALGGTFVVPFAIYTPEIRAYIREKLGSQCIFAILNMGFDLHVKRLAKKMLGSSQESVAEDVLNKKIEEMRKSKMTKGYVPMVEGEANSFAVDMTPEMDTNDVINCILEKLKSFD